MDAGIWKDRFGKPVSAITDAQSRCEKQKSDDEQNGKYDYFHLTLDRYENSFRYNETRFLLGFFLKKFLES